MNIVIAAGGTAGHINPGISIANIIKKYYPDAKITFIGTEYGLEGKLVPKAGYDIKFIHSKGLSKNPIKLAKSIFANTRGICEAHKLLKELNPKVVKQIESDLIRLEKNANRFDNASKDISNPSFLRTFYNSFIEYIGGDLKHKITKPIYDTDNEITKQYNKLKEDTDMIRLTLFESSDEDKKSFKTLGATKT